MCIRDSADIAGWRNGAASPGSCLDGVVAVAAAATAIVAPVCLSLIHILIMYSHGEYFALGKYLGKFGYSVQKKKKRKK